MKFACCTELFEGWKLRRIFDHLAKDCGYTAAELTPFSVNEGDGDIRGVSAAKRRGIAKTASNAGIEIIGLHWLFAKIKNSAQQFHVTSSSSETRLRTAIYLQDLAKFCADIGGKVMVLGSPPNRDLRGADVRDAFSNVVETLRRVVPTLEQTGVTLALEPLAECENDFVTTAEEASILATTVDSKYVQLLLDCKAIELGEKETASVATLIRKYGNLLAHFHANESNLQAPGYGDLDFAKIFRALLDINYQGYVSVEAFNSDPDVNQFAKESLRHMWKKLDAASQMPSQAC
ncbi:sugar phosphate isomerase/epimerase [Patescibacteria group bacterium]|nr:sugar phosphate isomerase/epimerase [Patescibacteria group bacterium]MBU1123533.1 sugar phosphate isomerase/epimerase [Patescibacteria group bacterium]MBU1911631.1 sugar phosphate isomerase/epimerase [Patescibacteria group bacterium]